MGNVLAKLYVSYSIKSDKLAHGRRQEDGIPFLAANQEVDALRPIRLLVRHRSPRISVHEQGHLLDAPVQAVAQRRHAGHATERRATAH